MEQIETIKQNLIDAIEECAWVVEGGDAHDLIDAVEKAHASMAESLDLVRQLENERIVMLEDMRSICTLCVYAMPCYPFDCAGKDMGELCEKCPCRDCIKGSKWQWRGVQKEDKT